jgi:hypothetical protein
VDAVVGILRWTDWDDPLGRAAWAGVLAGLDWTLSAILPERESACDEFRDAYLRHEKTPWDAGMGRLER